MIDDCLQIGDEVVITVPKGNREAGYNPCPDGTKAVVLGFSESYYGRLDSFGLKPGVYVNRCGTTLRRLDDGSELLLGTHCFELDDQTEYERRVAEFRKRQQENPDWFRDSHEFLRELPETPFWEGDFVRVTRRSRLTVITRESPPERDPEIFQIIGIDYAFLTKMTGAGTKYPAYKISDKLSSGWQTSASEDDMVLIERGPVWKYYHGEPITFADLNEEADFFTRLGHTKEVRNPANGLHKWTLEEVLEAIKTGLVHGFNMGSGLFGGEPSISARRFNNEELGRRVAQKTLEGFTAVPA